MIRSSQITSLVSGLGLIAICVVASGCCAPVVRADKYLHRWDLTETVRQFQMAVELKQDEIAYACLSPADQEEYDQTLFELLLFLGTVEQLRDVSVRDAISNSKYDGQWFVDEDETTGWAILEYVDEERGVAADIRFHFVKIAVADDYEWRLDLLQTAQQFRMNQ